MTHSGVAEALAEQLRIMREKSSPLDREYLKRVRQLVMHLGAAGYIRSCAPPKERGVELGLWSPTADAIAKEHGVDPRDVESLIQSFAPKEDVGEKLKALGHQFAIQTRTSSPGLNRKHRRAEKARARKGQQ